MKPAVERLQAKASDWNVTIEETRETPSSLLGFGVRAGVRVVLKITKVSGDESHSRKMLRAYSRCPPRVSRPISKIIVEQALPGKYFE